MSTLHEHNYDIGKASLSLVTTNGPIICKDEMEDWSAAEANLFECKFLQRLLLFIYKFQSI
jgi:hypothetical protein